MQRIDFNPIGESPKWRPTSAVGRPSVGGLRTSRVLGRCHASRAPSAPVGAVPNRRQHACKARASIVEGRPSFGGRLTSGGVQAAARGGHSLSLAALAHLKPSRSAVAARQIVALVHQTAGYGLPNPVFNRTPCGSPPLAFISFWAKRGLPQGAG